MDTKSCIIYSLSDPNTECIRYIGKTVVNTNRRYNFHINETKRGGSTHKNNWINKLLSKNSYPIIDVIDEVPIKDSIFWEKHYIRLFRGFGAYLTNLTEGGEGSPGIIPWNKGKKNIYSKDTINKMKEAHKRENLSGETLLKMRLARLGKKHTEEWKKNMSKRVKGKGNPMYGNIGGMKDKKHTIETKKKMSEAQMGKIHNEKTKSKMSNAKKGKTWEQIFGIEETELKRNGLIDRNKENSWRTIWKNRAEKESRKINRK